jgi:transposase InsO family protein
MMTQDETPRDDRAQKVALFRYGLIADLVHWEPGQRGLGQKLEEKAKHSYHIPYSRRTRVAVETMRDWLEAYRRGGFDALVPRVRSDKGRPRHIPLPVADLLCKIKEDNRELTVALVCEQARQSGEVPPDLELPPSTVHRLLSRAGLMDKLPAEPTSKDRRHFSFAKAGELWLSDVMHGPAVTVEQKRRRKTYLIAVLDDATRLVPYAAFALSENVAAFLPVLRQAIERRGIPLRLYVDNGAAYRSQHVALVCAKLGITLIHSRPRVPQGRGKIERWFRTVRLQLLPILCESDLASLESLNRKLWSWVEGEYHHAPHKGLEGDTPLDRWARSCDEVRLVEPRLDLEALFLFEEKRKVQRDRTVSLRGVLYEVDAALVGDTVTLRFDPSRPRRTVEVWHKGKMVQRAKPVDAYANCFVRRDHSTKALVPQQSAQAPAPGLRLRDFDDQKGGR